MTVMGLIYSPKMLIQDYCQAGRTPDSLLFNISICKLAEDSEDVLIRHAADMELSGTANTTDDRLKIHCDDPPQAGVMGRNQQYS